MAEMLVEPTGAILSGTDAASPIGKESTEVLLDSRGGDAPQSLRESGLRTRPMEAVIARLRAREAAGPEPTAEPEAPAEEAAEAPEEALDEAPETDTDAAAPAEKPAPVAPSLDLDATRAESALLRSRILDLESGAVSKDDWAAYVDDPLAVMRGEIARRLKVSADDKLVDKELAWISRKLTADAIGVSNLSDDGRDRLAREESDRRWGLDQQSRVGDRKTAQERDSRAQAIRQFASLYEQEKDQYPALELATDLDGRDPAEVAAAIYLGALNQGLIKPDLSNEEAIREALRLSNQFYVNKANKVRQRTAPVQPPASAQASATARPPGAPKPAPSVAPAKTGAAAPRTLSAKQAAAAPVAKAAGDAKRTIVEIDPNDRDSRLARVRAIAERRFAKPLR